ncbi:hypothetical protein AgCh_006171 [Apium graveolens]
MVEMKIDKLEAVKSFSRLDFPLLLTLFLVLALHLTRVNILWQEEVHLMVETGLEAYRKAFVAYADVCFREFGDRVLHWTTFNEPNVFAHYVYDFGVFQPNRCSSPFGTNCTKGNSSTEPYIVAHNIILAHAATARLYLKKYKAVQHGFIGIDLYAYWYVPYTNAVEDAIATERAYDFFIGWFLNPLVYGDYPDIMKKNAGTRIPTFTKLESRLVKGSFDLLGMNHYKTIQVEDMSLSLQMDVRDFTADMAVNLILNDSNVPQGQLPSNPTGLRDLLEHLKNHGNPPIYIYENGYGLYYVDLDDKDLTKWYSNFLKGSSTSLDQDILKENQTGVDDSTMTVAEAEIAERSVGTTIEF